MNDDIRLSLTFRHHRKRKRLFHRLGAEGVVSLVDLWCMTAEQYPDGFLKGYSKEDIEIDAGWGGKPGEFFGTIIDVGFLDKGENGFHLHNWAKHQVWVSKSPERSNVSRMNILAKKHKKVFKALKEMDVNGINKQDYAFLTDLEVPLKQRLEEFKQRLSTALSDASKTSSEFKPNARYPLSVNRSPLSKDNPTIEKNQSFQPAPKKSTPAKGAGNFISKNKDVKNSDFSINLSETFSKINTACEKIISLPSRKGTKKGSFIPMEWAQKMVKAQKHPGAILKCLEGLILFWTEAGDPWGYCTKNIAKFNGNFNEQESISINEELKRQSLNGDLRSLTNGLFEQLI